MPPKVAEKKKEEKKDEKEEKKEEKKEEGETKEGEKKESAEVKVDSSSEGTQKKECKGESSCAGNGVAKAFEAPAGVLTYVKNEVDDGVKRGVKTLLTGITNPAKCATIVVGAVPGLIGSIFDSVAGGINKVADSFSNLSSNAAEKGFDDILAPLKIGRAMFVQKLEGVAADIALGPDFWQKHPEFKGMEPKAVATIVVDSAMKRTGIYNMAFEDAQFRGIFKEWLSKYMDSLMKVLKIAQPEIDRINSEIKSIIEGMGSNAGDALGHALTNVIASALGALPVVGGVVSGINALDQLGKKIIDSCEPPLTKGAGIIMPMVNGFNKQKSRLECEVENLTNKIKPPIERLEAKMAKLENKLTPQSGGGGMRSGAGSKKKIQKKIHMTQKRVAHLLNRFTRRKHKTNYTRRLMRSRF